MAGKSQGCSRSVIVRLGRQELAAVSALNLMEMKKRERNREAGGMARHEWESQLQYTHLPKG
jgi:hypothetical protein